MNTSPPFSNPPFTFHPPNPNPNPNLNLHTTLQALKTLIQISQTTLSAATTTTHRLPSSAHHHHHLIPCPFNPHHRLPPQSLFRHSLRCSNLDPETLTSNLNYPNSIQSESELRNQTHFKHHSNTDLCFSIDNFADFGANFFYRDCPAVVSSVDRDRTANTFTLPAVLSSQCANFSNGNDIKVFDNCRLKLLPSEFWVVKSELEAWNDYPSAYSYTVLRAILCIGMGVECDMLKWVISNSTFYGIVIDGYMRDHIFLLLRLCLKAIIVEAKGTFVLNLNPNGLGLKCPILIEVLKWLSTQFSVLYGEINGKFFAINMFKQCVLVDAKGSLVFPLEEASSKSDISVELGDVFVSQVAAAVAALHERSMLEEKIKYLRGSQQHTKYQLMTRHAYLTNRADEERKTRPNFRPIIDHDGLPSQRPRNQETDKYKTREQLLAEERDYKRRRMSYRGKKSKRSKTEVMKDIIEEYMEEIKQAGGIGCFVKGAEEGVMFPAGPSSEHTIKMDVNELKQHAGDSQSHGQSKQSHADYVRSANDSVKDYVGPRRDSHGHDDHPEDHRSKSREKHHRNSSRDRGYYSRSPDRYRSQSRSRELSSHRRERDDDHGTITKHHEIVKVSSKSKYHESRSYSRSHSTAQNDDRVSEIKDDRRKNVDGNYRLDSRRQNDFEDRYDPSEFRDKDYDIYSGSKNAGTT